jgi:hypothetical protein
MKKLALATLLLVFATGFVAMIGCGNNHNLSVSNVMPVNVGQFAGNFSSCSDATPCFGYPNDVFASVTVCQPGTTNCTTIPYVLVDTGSIGLRVVASALGSISLPRQTSGSQTIGECYPFVDSVIWGPLAKADITLGGKTATNVPVQVIGDTSFASPPSACTSSGLAVQDTANALGANGILGIQFYPDDCGTTCSSSSTNGAYYGCAGGSCSGVSEAESNQVQNPVSMFGSDNNGIVMDLPSVPASGAPQQAGQVIFGVSTQSDNGLGSATILVPGSSGGITTNWNGTDYANSFLDSGSNAYFFLDSTTTGMPTCTDTKDFGSGITSFYCPTSTQNFTITNKGTNGSSSTVTISVANTQTLFSSNSGNNGVFNDLGGVGASGLGFDLGAPFFLGRKIFLVNYGVSLGGQTGPFWAY